MADEEITLYDPELNVTVDIVLSAEDAARARIDMVFACRLLAAAQESESRKRNETAEDEPQPDVNSAGDKNLAPADGDDGSLYRWTTPCVLLLLDAFKTIEGKFCNGKQSQKKTWDEVAQILRQKGHSITGPQCAAKLRSLKKTFKSVKDHNSRSGNDRRSWQFYEIMDNIFSKKAWCAPVALASSTGLSIRQDQGSSSQVSDSTSTSDSRRSGKLSVTALLAKRIKQKEEHEEAKAKRHRERMEMDQKLLSVLEQLAKNK